MRNNSLKYAAVPAAILALAAIATTASAEDRPVTKGPTETMGDEGKLPATNAVGGQVRDMTGPQSATTPSAAEGNSSGTSGKATEQAHGRRGHAARDGHHGRRRSPT